MRKPLTLLLEVAVVTLPVFAYLQATAYTQQKAAPEGNGRLAGRVLSESGEPVANAEVSLACPPLPVLRVPTSADGSFELNKLPPGNCALRSRKPGFVEASLPLSDSYGVRVDVRTKRDDIVLVLRAGVILTGRVTLATGVPAGPSFIVHPIRVDATSRDGIKAYSYVRLRPDGTFRFENLPVGDYYVAAGPNPNSATDSRTGYGLTYYPGTLAFRNSRVVSLKSGESANVEIDLLPAPLYTVSGQALDRNGLPAGGARATIMLAEAPKFIRGDVSVDEDGRFTLSGVQAGSYRLSVARPFGQGKPSDMAETRIEIGDRDVAGVVLVLKPRK